VLWGYNASDHAGNPAHSRRSHSGIEYKAHEGITLPLSASPPCGRVAAWALFISGAIAYHKTNADVTEILRAAGNGDLAKTRLLLNHNPNLVFSKNSEGFTALHYAASYGYTEIAELLLAKDADVNAKTSKGDAPLHYAASYGHKDIVELLLSNKAKVDVRDGTGCTPLYDAATSGQIEEVRMLLTAKADVNAGTLRGYTPLSGAASHGREEIVRLLIDSGANVNAADFDGGAPLYWARIRGYDRIQDLLRQHGALELPHAKPEWSYP
jgi:ankyrin repeat protein